jgi:hypothetical protein
MSNKLPETSGSEEVDLGQLFKLLGDAFERFFKLVSSVLGKLFMAFVWTVFFIKKNILKLAIAGILGFGVALIKEKLTGPVYSSTVTVRQNYDSGENLYDIIGYYNSLVERQNSTSLGSTLNLNEQQIKTIIGFEVAPIVNENTRIKDYNDYIKGLDSTLASSIDYETYIENTQEYDYSNQKISIVTNDVINLEEVFNKIIDNINTTAYFKRQQEKDLNQLSNRETAIKQSLEESRGLQETYKKVLEAKEQQQKGSQTSVTVEGSGSVKQTKEFELFENDLTLRRELVEIERSKEDKKQITEILSDDLNNALVSNDTKILNVSINRKIFYALIFMFLTFMALFGIEFIKFLEKYKNEV